MYRLSDQFILFFVLRKINKLLMRIDDQLHCHFDKCEDKSIDYFVFLFCQMTYTLDEILLRDYREFYLR